MPPTRRFLGLWRRSRGFLRSPSRLFPVTPMQIASACFCWAERLKNEHRACANALLFIYLQWYFPFENG